jgi:DNA replication protein DnaC
VATLLQMIRTRGARGLFYDTRDLLRVIRSTYDPVNRTAEMDVLGPVMRADVLVLDDLGAEKTSEWVEETMNLIVNTATARSAHLFTTNYDDNPDITDPDSLLFRIGARMRSRLHEMCEGLYLSGADYRELPPNGGVEELMTLWKMRRKTVRKPPLPGRTAAGARPAARARWQGRPEVVGRPRRLLEVHPYRPTSPTVLRLIRARALRSRSLLRRHLQLLQLQPRPVRCGAEAQYVEAVLDEIPLRARGTPADTIFFGGGTPSLLEPAEIAAIIRPAASRSI